MPDARILSLNVALNSFTREPHLMELLQGPGTFFFPWPRGQGTGRRKKKQVLAPNPLKSQFLLSFGQGILMRFGKSSINVYRILGEWILNSLSMASSSPKPMLEEAIDRESMNRLRLRILYSFLKPPLATAISITDLWSSLGDFWFSFT